MKTIGTKLKEKRLEKGIVQRRMARELGVTVQTILNIENNKCLKISTLEKIADYLGVEIRAFIVEAKD